jgi:class 3 adenylate cyclase/predicted ATPase
MLVTSNANSSVRRVPECLLPRSVHGAVHGCVGSIAARRSTYRNGGFARRVLQGGRQLTAKRCRFYGGRSDWDMITSKADIVSARSSRRPWVECWPSPRARESGQGIAKTGHMNCASGWLRVSLDTRCAKVDPGLDAARLIGGTMDVAEWLRNLGLEQYAAAFRKNAVTAELLRGLTAEDLKDLGVIPLGHRRRIQQAIAELRPDGVSGGGLSQNDGGDGQPSKGTAERRPLSVMFCDLVGSTMLSSRLDPEDLGVVIRTYQARVQQTMARFGGFIARYVGDGVLIYFGWPEAQETDADRAVRAALALAAAVSEEPIAGETLQVRIGIATGLVVVGESIGAGDARQQTAIGETPNRAARLQGLAGPNGVIIDVTTRRQVGELFEYRDLGPVELKGLREPVQAWSVHGESAVESRFEALRATPLTPLIGRDEELEQLHRCWQQARAGEAQAVLLSGEAGIGKSRLVVALRELITSEPHVWLPCFCSPHHQDSALHPIIAHLRRAAGFQAVDTAEARWAKLEALLAPTAASDTELALLGDLLSLPSRDGPESVNLTQQQRRRQTTEALLRQMIGLGRHRPVLAVFEDMHWADPSTHDLLDRLISELSDQPVLLVLTFRPEFQPSWAKLAHVTSLVLPRLDEHQGAALVRKIAGPEQVLSADLIEEIVSRTDGVPLFLEELTSATLEAGVRPGSVPEVVASAPPMSSGVPASLHASLMARLDRLGPNVREVAQIGSVIGREFGYELLEIVAGRSNEELLRALDQLTRAGLIFRRGSIAGASYLFKHALVVDVAYNTLLRTRRRQLHAAIAQALADHFPEQRNNQPELVAHHFTEAAQPDKAVHYWLQAGRRSANRSADHEAIRQLQRGLDVSMTLPVSADRDRTELAFQLALGTPLVSVHGYSSPRGAVTYERVSVLCERLGDTEGVIMALFGLRSHRMVRGETREALRLAEQCLSVAECYHERDYRLLGYYGLGIMWLHIGELSKARSNFESVVTLSGANRDRSLATRCIIDPYATALAYLSLIQWMLGYPVQARRRADEALQCATELEHANTTGLVRVFAGAHLAQLLRDVPATREYADAVIALVRRYDLPPWQPYGLAFQGWVSGEVNQAQDGIALVKQAIAELDATATIVHRAHYLGILATLHARCGEFAAGLDVIREAHRCIQQYEHCLWHAELCRIEGEVLRQAGASHEQVEHCFATAIELARQQEAKSFELRATTSLAQLWRDQRRDSEAHDLLRSVYEWFTEGFDTPDLIDAKTLLGEFR